MNDDWDSRGRGFEHFALAIFVSALLWIGVLFALRIFVELKSCAG